MADVQPSRVKLSILIPLYNEIDNVDPLLEALGTTLKEIGETYQIILVDDGSRDGTTDKILERARQDPHLK